MPPQVNYSEILRGVAHDMRNSLTMMLQSLHAVSQQSQGQEKQITATQLSDINYQVQRLSGGLTQIMSLYSAEEDHLSVNVDQVLVHDLIESVVCQNELFTDSSGIDCQLDLDVDLVWPLDHELISYLIDDVLSNAIRYSKERIIIRAHVTNEQLEITIIDDSDGYPNKMISAAQAPLHELDTEYGRMGIGLLFSRLIAISHRKADITGQVTLLNNSELGGSSFKIRLP